MSKIVGYSGASRCPSDKALALSKVVRFDRPLGALRMQRLGAYSPQLYRSVYVPPATPARAYGCCGSACGSDSATNAQGQGFALGIGVGVVAGVLIGSLLRFA